MIHHLLGILAKFVTDWIFCTGYRREDIEACIKFSWPAYSTFHNMGENATMCHRIKNACRDYKISERILVCYADELADIDLAALNAAHHRAINDITFTTYHMKLPFGVAVPNAVNQVPGICEMNLPVNIGFCVLEPVAIEAMNEKQDLADFITQYGLANGKVGTYEHEGKRVTVNSLMEWEVAEEVWK